MPFETATSNDTGKMDKMSRKSNFTMTREIVKRYASTDRILTHLFTDIHKSDIYIRWSSGS